MFRLVATRARYIVVRLPALIVLLFATAPLTAQAPCNEADTVGGGSLGVSPGPVGPPDSLGWDVGSGQCNGSFVLAADPAFPGGALELALRAEERRIGQVPRMPGGDYEVELGADNNPPAAVNRAWWNFQFSIAYGGVIGDLDALTLQIRTDAGDNQPASPTVDLLAPGLRALIDGRNNQPNATSTFADLYQVSQNPEFGWFMHPADTDANPTGAFDYDEEGAWRMRLTAVEGGTELAAEMCIHTPNAACRFPNLGAAKRMESLDATLPATIQILYTVENLGDDAVQDLAIEDDLAAVFGTPGLDWNFTSIMSMPASLANPAFDGSGDIQLINQAPTQGLAAGGVGTVNVSIELLTIDAVDMNGQFCNQVMATGRDSLGATYDDLSTEGLDPDPDGDGEPSEAVAACFDQGDVPVSLESFSVE